MKPPPRPPEKKLKIEPPHHKVNGQPPKHVACVLVLSWRVTKGPIRSRRGPSWHEGAQSRGKPLPRNWGLGV